MSASEFVELLDRALRAYRSPTGLTWLHLLYTDDTYRASREQYETTPWLNTKEGIKWYWSTAMAVLETQSLKLWETFLRLVRAPNESGTVDFLSSEFCRTIAMQAVYNDVDAVFQAIDDAIKHANNCGCVRGRPIMQDTHLHPLHVLRVAAYTDQNTTALGERFAHLLRRNAAEYDIPVAEAGRKVLKTLFSTDVPIMPAWAKCAAFYTQCGVSLDALALAVTPPFHAVAVQHLTRSSRTEENIPGDMLAQDILVAAGASTAVAAIRHCRWKEKDTIDQVQQLGAIIEMLLQLPGLEFHHSGAGMELVKMLLTHPYARQEGAFRPHGPRTLMLPENQILALRRMSKLPAAAPIWIDFFLSGESAIGPAELLNEIHQNAFGAPRVGASTEPEMQIQIDDLIRQQQEPMDATVLRRRQPMGIFARIKSYFWR